MQTNGNLSTRAGSGKKKVLVTGGLGFIGSHLVDKLVEQGDDVTVLDHLVKENLNPDIFLISKDIRNYKVLKDVVVGKDIIYHLAAETTTKENSLGWDDVVKDYEINALGTLDLFRAVVETKTDPRIIYASSAAVYGNPQYTPMGEQHPTFPISPYGISKLTGEKYAYAYYKEYGLKITSLRIFNTYGIGQTRYVMIDFLKKLINNPNQLEIMGNGEHIRDYCYISDTVDAFILAGKCDNTIGEVLNVAGGEPISISNLARTMIKLLGLGNKVKLLFTDESWKGDIDVLKADITLINILTGFKPKVSLIEGLELLINWFLTEEKCKP